MLCGWRIDRLGRTVSGLSALFEELRTRRVNLVSLRDGLDLSTAGGRLMANLLAGVAEYDNELRAERVIAGQAVARAKGKRWGGSAAGVRKKVTPEQERTTARGLAPFGPSAGDEFVLWGLLTLEVLLTGAWVIRRLMSVARPASAATAER